MLITIDTNNYTPTDRSLVAQALNLYEVQHITESAPAAETPKPVRKRRTKAEIAADEAAAKAAAGGGQETPEEHTNEPTPDEDRNAEVHSGEIVNLKVTVEQVVEEASKLIAADKTKMRAILDKFEVRRIGEVPEERLGELLAAVKDQLSKLPAAV